MTEAQKCLYYIAENMRMDKSISKEGYGYFQQAIEALEQEPRWIPVSERLPKESEYVGDVRKHYLVQDEYGDMHVAHYKKIGWIPIHSLKALGDEVIAWMPLPEPYVPKINVGGMAESEDKE